MHKWDRVEIAIRRIGNGYVGHSRVYAGCDMVITEEFFGRELSDMKLLAEQAIDTAEEDLTSGDKEQAF